MEVEIWSDVACPWCYIGKRRFESALTSFAHRDQVEVFWRSYQLDPHASHEPGKTVNEVLMQKYGLSHAQAAAMNDRVSDLAAQEGLEYHLEKAQYCNSFDAHRLIHFAATHQMQNEMQERIFQAYFTEGLALGDHEPLLKLATEVGIDEGEARTTLESSAYADDVRADIQMARELGIQGVPFFVIDGRYGISGAQPSKLFVEALQRVWSESHPSVKIGFGTRTDADICDDRGCAIS